MDAAGPASAVSMSEPGPTFCPSALVSALSNLPATAWGQSLASTEEVNPGYQFATLVACRNEKDGAALFRFVLDEFAPIWTAWLAKVPAHGFIRLHIDEGPYRERWHVPIVPTGTFNGHPVYAGVSFPVHHWKPHRVDNPTGQARVHLVIDRDLMVDVPSAPFQRIEEP